MKTMYWKGTETSGATDWEGVAGVQGADGREQSGKSEVERKQTPGPFRKARTQLCSWETGNGASKPAPLQDP